VLLGPRTRGKKGAWTDDFEFDDSEDYDPRRTGSRGKQHEVVRTKHGRQVKRRVTSSPDESPDETASAPPGNRLCWFRASREDSHAATQSLRLIQPFVVHACREHAVRVESAFREATSAGRIMITEGLSKDACCGVCGGTSGSKELVTCGERLCSFSFCRSCVSSLQYAETHDDCIAYSFDDIDRFARAGKWSCCVCYAERSTGKPRDRPRVLREILAGKGPASATAASTEGTGGANMHDEEDYSDSATRAERLDEDYEAPDRFGRTPQLASARPKKRRHHREAQPPPQETPYNIPLQTFVRSIVDRLAVYQQSGWRDDKVFEVIGRLMEASHQFMQATVFTAREDAEFRNVLMHLAVMIRQNT